MSFQMCKFLVTVLLFAFTTHTSAYDQKSCMQGLDSSLKSTAALDEAIGKMFNSNMTLRSSGVFIDSEIVDFITEKAEQVSISLKASVVMSTLRQHGSYKQQKFIDELIRSEFQVTFERVRRVKATLVKFTGTLKNPKLQEQAFQLSQELERITAQISACQK